MQVTTVIITNPWTGKITEHDISALTQEQLDAYAILMNDQIREELHDALAPCSPAEFLAAWVNCVGPDEAGIVILGS